MANPPVFRYGDLPLEIQERVLKFTDLVSCYDLAWTPSLGLTYDYWLSTIHYCSTCSMAHTPSERERGRSTTIPRRCVCWQFPLSLFLACRWMHEAATRIFYSSNHFKVIPGSLSDGENDTIDVYPPPFITTLPQSALASLRSVHFIFEWPSDFSSPELSYEAWDNAMDRLRLANLHALGITIDISCADWRYNSTRYPVSQGNDDEPRSRHRRLLEPLITLRERGLKDLVIHLQCSIYDGKAAEWIKHRENDLERMVMGDDYSSRHRGNGAALD